MGREIVIWLVKDMYLPYVTTCHVGLLVFFRSLYYHKQIIDSRRSSCESRIPCERISCGYVHRCYR